MFIELAGKDKSVVNGGLTFYVDTKKKRIGYVKRAGDRVISEGERNSKTAFRMMLTQDHVSGSLTEAEDTELRHRCMDVKDIPEKP